jgi:hypothetical protein
MICRDTVAIDYEQRVTYPLPWKEMWPRGWWSRTFRGSASFYGGAWHEVMGELHTGDLVPACNPRWKWPKDECELVWVPGWTEAWRLDCRTDQSPFPRGTRYKGRGWQKVGGSGRPCTRCMAHYRQKVREFTMAQTRKVRVKVEIETGKGTRIYTGYVKQLSQRRETMSWAPGEDEEDIPDIGKPMLELVFIADKITRGRKGEYVADVSEDDGDDEP